MTMKKMWVWMVLTLFTLVGEWHGRCYGCLEEERIGLLEIKSSIHPYGFSLIDWVDTSNESISNCCEWGGVECDNTTRRVIELDLRGVRDVSLGDFVLNASLFLPFKELRSLALGNNAIVGCHENQGFEVLSSKLTKLNFLGLRDMSKGGLQHMNIPLEEEINKEEEASNDSKEEDLGIQASEEEVVETPPEEDEDNNL
ncbi:hypothetical protein DKX38_006883 [Salix brachista]|uniref:Leucine-rich repeat-containing N-terminal plant-type domain-containing protein n=1 Tax=Salix brachista TaxID=2182728 RepID=A0A5N5MLM7_9ROSI|nr:hypothetical protein DKX38_006883 [Salix brachista]